MKLLNWNTEWAVPERVHGRRVIGQIEKADADIICLTEAYPDIFPESGHAITSGTNTGYELPGGRRKVLLWSREPWTEVSLREDTSMPGGRVVSGITSGIRVVALCIPWRMAHVNTGRKDRKPWEDHLAYLEHLGPILNEYMEASEPLLVTGDWNQRIPKAQWQPELVYDALMSALPYSLEVVTKGHFDGIEGQLIDHLAISPEITTKKLHWIQTHDEKGNRLSDHVGYCADLSLTEES